MHKGLRQGDPLSLFMFVLVMEVFNRMVSKAIELQLVQGLRVGKENVVISHL